MKLSFFALKVNFTQRPDSTVFDLIGILKENKLSHVLHTYFPCSTVPSQNWRGLRAYSA